MKFLTHIPHLELAHKKSSKGRAPKGFAPIAIGLALTLIHLISIFITNTSVNPDRSTDLALFAGVELFNGT